MSSRDADQVVIHLERARESAKPITHIKVRTNTGVS